MRDAPPFFDLFDAHCHIAPETGDAPEPAETGIAAGRLLCGVGAEDWDAVENAAATWPGTRPAFGLHPWHAARTPGDWLERLEEKLARNAGAWLGEAGLDGLKTDESPPALQREVFAAQLRLAKRLKRPVNLHCVKAWDELVALLDAEYLDAAGGEAFIVHSFGGPHQYIKPLAERGACFSVGPLFSRHDSRRRRERAALLPGDGILLESDAFLRPGRDATGDLAHTLDWLAEARGCDAGPLAETIAATSRRIFSHG